MLEINDYIEQVMSNALRDRDSLTPLQQMVVEHLKEDLEGRNIHGVGDFLREEIGRRATTPRYKGHAPVSR